MDGESLSEPPTTDINKSVFIFAPLSKITNETLMRYQQMCTDVLLANNMYLVRGTTANVTLKMFDFNC